MPAPSTILLYGSLLPGSAAWTALDLQACLLPVARLRLPGTMYDAGRYPVVVPMTRDRFTAIACAIRDPRVVRTLDAFEAVDDDTGTPTSLARVVVTVDGLGPCWIYAFAGDVSRMAEVASGDWSARGG